MLEGSWQYITITGSFEKALQVLGKLLRPYSSFVRIIHIYFHSRHGLLKNTFCFLCPVTDPDLQFRLRVVGRQDGGKNCEAIAVFDCIPCGCFIGSIAADQNFWRSRRS